LNIWSTVISTPHYKALYTLVYVLLHCTPAENVGQPIQTHNTDVHMIRYNLNCNVNLIMVKVIENIHCTHETDLLISVNSRLKVCVNL